jgi:hypothetical protein
MYANIDSRVDSYHLTLAARIAEGNSAIAASMIEVFAIMMLTFLQLLLNEVFGCTTVRGSEVRRYISCHG